MAATYSAPENHAAVRIRGGLALVVAALVGLTAAAAQAREPRTARAAIDDYADHDLPQGANIWHCWYDGAVSIRCRLGEAAVAPAAGKPGVDPRLPGFMRKVWQQAAELAGSVVVIPLHTVPFDMAMTGRLASAVMCGGATQPCGVVFARNEALLAEALERRASESAARRLAGLALAD